MQTVYVVIGYYDYYPAPDNTLGVFFSRKSAYNFLGEYKKIGNCCFDFYDVIEHQVRP
jgi:hypothetical protein